MKKNFCFDNFYQMREDGLKELLQHIGLITRKYRKEKGLSQFKLGLEIGKSANQIGRIERAESNPTVETLFELASFFKISISDFFYSDVGGDSGS